MKRSFPPVVSADTRLLIVGSLPGEASLAQAQYYAHPRNQFWLLMSDVVGRELVPLAYPDRLAALLKAKVGLWDSVASARRAGSLDGAIRDHSPNDLAALASRLPALKAVGFNGGKAATIGRRALAGAGRHELIDLPSSSPAFTLALSEKRARWTPLRAFIA